MPAQDETPVPYRGFSQNAELRSLADYLPQEYDAALDATLAPSFEFSVENLVGGDLEERMSQGSGGVRRAAGDPTKYHRAGDVAFERGGQAIGGVIPYRGNTPGTVVPAAGPVGCSLGWNPHRPPKNTVNVDPHLPLYAFQVDLDRINKQSAKQASQVAHAAVQNSGLARDIDGRRALGAAYFQVANALGKDIAPVQKTDRGLPVEGPQFAPSGGQPRRPQAPQPKPMPAVTFVQEEPQPQERSPAPMQPQPPASMLDGFASPAKPRAAVPQPPPSRPSGPVPDPTFKVTFDIAGFGQTTNWYHSIEIKEGVNPETGIMVLGINAEYRGTQYLPTNVGAPFALHVDGSPYFYLVESMGFEFPHAGENLVILEIQGRKPTSG